MRNPPLVLMCLLALNRAALESPSQTIDLKSELVSLVNSELAFSRAATDKGTRGAFLAFLAEQSVVFRPEPVDGRSHYSEIPEPKSVLSWYPVIARISRTADLGYTTGPYESRSVKPGVAVQHGYYLSVWRRQKDGNWRVILDIGSPGPAPPTRPAPWQPPASWQPDFTQPAGNPESQRDILMDLDRQCTAISRSKGPAVAYAAYLADNARLHLPMAQPIAGKAGILAFVNNDARLSWSPTSAEVARGADLGCTYGKRTDMAVPGRSYYTRIWKRDQSGRWKLVLEVNTLPARAQIANRSVAAGR